MARYYRRAFKKRSYRRRRSYYSRRRRYYANRRRYKRLKRRKTEYKRVEASQALTFSVEKVTLLNNTTQSATSFEYYAGKLIDGICIGGYNQNSSMPQLGIAQGTRSSERIGAKINPVKLRVYGTISLVNPNPPTNMLELPTTVYMRCIVFQVRNGNPIYSAGSSSFSSINPVFSRDEDSINGMLHWSTLTGQRLFSEYYGTEAYTTTGVAPNIRFYARSSILSTDFQRYTQLAKVPFRIGIGGSMKVLKDKTYMLNTTKANSFAFRFKVKKPNRMVWPEEGPQNVLPYPKNPIYIMWFYIPTVRNMASNNAGEDIRTGDVELSYNFQLFYTDS